MARAGWTRVVELGAAFVLSGIIGLERELKQKAAGLRTYPVVGFGAALFMPVSKARSSWTTAASVWLTAAVGSATGAGLLVLAAIATGGYLVIALGLPVVSYVDGRGELDGVLAVATAEESEPG